MRKRGTNNNEKTRKLTKKLTQLFRKQFIFSRVRRFRTKFISKVIDDQLLKLFSPSFHLITCKNCTKIKKARLTSSRTCIDCSFTPRIKKLQDLCWSSWEFTP
jgi:hypothetical protein